MCAVTSIVDRSVRSIESIDGRYGGCWRRSSPKPPSHKPRRRLNSSSTPGPVDCARAVWRETLSWVPFGAAPPQVTRLSPPTIPSKPPRSSSPGTTMLGQSPLTRAHCGGGGARSLPRSRARCGGKPLGAFRCRPPQVTRLTPPDNPLQTVPFLIARYDDARAKPTHARALRRRRRSLARSIARAVCGGCGGGGGRLHRPSRALRAPRVTRVYAYVITAHRARHRRFRPPRARPARARCSGGGARSLPRLRARGVAVVMVMAVAVGHAARDARNARRASRIRTRASSPRIARVITAPFPDVNHARARRSLARSSAAAYVATPHTARARVI